MLGRFGVGARHFKELLAWQAADSLRRQVIGITASGPCARDFKFVDQIRRAASSACANIAEGFGRYQHKEFAQFLSIAKGSLSEVQDHVLTGHEMNYWNADTTQRLEAETLKAIRLTAALMNHLRHSKAP